MEDWQRSVIQEMAAYISLSLHISLNLLENMAWTTCMDCFI